MSDPKPQSDDLRISIPRTARDERPPASVPGSLHHVGERLTDETTFHLFDYTPTDFAEISSASLAECLAADVPGTPTWLQVHGLHDTAAIGELLAAFDIHPLVQEDILNTRHRPNAEDFGDYVFIAAKEIFYDPSEHRIEIRHLSILLKESIVITFHERPSGVLDPVEERLRSSKGLLRTEGCDYLTWAILDALTDHYRIALDEITGQLERMEDSIDAGKSNFNANDLHDIKRETDHLDRAIRPMREIASNLKRTESKLLGDSIHVFWSDLHDHAVQSVESADAMRETIASLRTLHLSLQNQRMNEAMRVLTAFATIFMPLTFVAGVYGMNFKHMPELNWRWAYPVLLMAFVFAGAGIFALFRLKRWL
jgi:magnesium transporter